MGSPTIFAGTRTKTLSSKGLILKDGSTIDNDGILNYIKNGHAEVNADGWSTFADAAASRPVDGTGGSPTITWTRTTTTPLRGVGSFLFTHPGTSSYQGEGVSYDFTIDKADQAKVLQIRFDYEIASGTYSGGTSSTDSDLIVYIYDVTNASLIEPSAIKLDGAVSGVQYQYRGEFQTASNSQSYRLILYKATTNTDAFTVKVDNVEVTPNVVSRGAVITDWASFTPTWGNDTNISWTINRAAWKRDGSDMLIELKATAGGTGSSSSSLQLTTLPNGANISDDVEIAQYLGHGYIDDISGNNQSLIVKRDGASGNIITFIYNGDTNNLQGTEITTGDVFTFNARIPIQGWGTSQTLSQDGGTRVVAASVFRSSTNQSLAASSSYQKIQFNAKSFDRTNSFDAITDYRFTAPEPGEYRIHGSLTFLAGTVDELFAVLYKNGTAYMDLGRVIINATYGMTLPFTVTDQAIAGDYYEVFVNTSGTAQTLISSAGIFGGSRLNIEKIQGPQQIAATETIAFRATSDSGATITSPAALYVYEDEVFDTHGAYNNSTGIFTCPAPGYYQFNASIQTATTTPAAGNVLAVRLLLDGVAQTAYLYRFVDTTTSTYQSFVSDVIKCNAGQQVTVTVEKTGTSTTSNTSGSATTSFFSGIRVGL